MRAPFPVRAALVATLTGCAPAAPAPPGGPSPVTEAAATGFPTTPPAAGPVARLRLPAAVRRTLPNGLTVVYIRHGALPVVHVRLLTPAGIAADPPTLPGLAAFTAAMLDEGAGGRNPLQLAAALEILGATLTTGAGWDGAYVDLHVLRDRLPRALPILADVVVRPDFQEAEVRRVREQSLTELARAGDQPTVIAANAFSALVHGPGHAYGRLSTTATTRRFDAAALRQFHQAYYRPAGSTLVLVGDVDADELHALVEQALGGWAGTAARVARPPDAPLPAATTIYLIDKPGAAQSEIRVGHRGVARDDPDYFPLLVLNATLTTRLHTNLRERHGFSYGAASSFSMRRGAGPFQASSAVFTAKTDSALVETLRELRRIRDTPVPDAELERAKRYLALSFPARFETTEEVAAQLAQLEALGLSPNVYDEFVPRLMAVTAADVQRAARESLHPDRAVVVVVGDRAAVETGLRAAGVGTLELRPSTEFVR